MNQKDIDRLVDALIKASNAMEKAITLLVESLPSKKEFDILKEDEKDGSK